MSESGGSNPVVTTTYGNADAVGRVLQSSQQIGSQTYNFSYNYDLSSSLVKETYPTGRAVTTGAQ